MSADAHAAAAPEVSHDEPRAMPPMSVLLAAGVAAEAVCTPPSASEHAPDLATDSAAEEPAPESAPRNADGRRDAA
jgi:hypothetical protein